MELVCTIMGCSSDPLMVNSSAIEICINQTHLSPGEGPAISAIMFATGVLGNLIALVLLERRRRSLRGKISLFHILVTGLVITDLLGTCMISPVVMASYAKNLTLMALDVQVCQYFAFAMTFFSLATMMFLFAMALERALAIGHPYFYNKFIRKRCGFITFPAIYFLCTIFSLLPFMDVGEYVQYCPGSWCFIDLRARGANGHRNLYSSMYASLLLILILAVITCNLIVIISLVRMHKRQKSMRLGSMKVSKKERVSMTEEIDHLILLALMTIVFIICSVPFTVQAFSPYSNYKADLLALRFLSVNPIFDPWIFTILRPSVLRVMRSVACCEMPSKRKELTPSPSLTSRISTKLTLVDPNYGSSHKIQLEDKDKIGCWDKTEA
ncbi:prostaglandin E2 receptor EP2 subtype [Discoglossus pictus]